MDKQLQPCPFCGAEVKKTTAPLSGIQMFMCDQCGATVSFYGSEDDLKATKAWNKRKSKGNDEDTAAKYHDMMTHFIEFWHKTNDEIYKKIMED